MRRIENASDKLFFGLLIRNDFHTKKSNFKNKVVFLKARFNFTIVFLNLALILLKYSRRVYIFGSRLRATPRTENHIYPDVFCRIGVQK